jgi:hypothetical protein
MGPNKANIHPRVREVIIRCLQKEQKKRYPEISQAHYEIEQVLADPSGICVQPVTTARPRKKLRVGLAWVAVALTIGAIIAGIFVWYLKPYEPRRIMRFDYHLPEDQQLNIGQAGQIPLAVAPDGSHFVYGTPEGLCIRSIDQLNVRLIPGTDGNTLVGTIAPGNFDTGALSMEGEREIGQLLHAEYAELQPQISPDGQWIAYSSNESGKYEIYVRPFPDVDKRRFPVSTDGGISPLWSPDGKELFYRNGDSVMAVIVEMEPDLSFGTPKVLFSGTYSLPNTSDFSRHTMWDIHPNGKLLLMIKPPNATDGQSTYGRPRTINIYLNWLEELKERVQVD